MLRSTDTAAPRHAQNHRHMQTTTCTVTQTRGMTNDVIDHRIHEAIELRFGNWLHAGNGHSNGQAGDRRFIQRRINDALRTELRMQTGCCTEHTTVNADVFAEYDNGGIVLHFISQCLRHGFNQSDRLCAHAWPSRCMANSRCSSTSGGMSAYR